MTIGLIVCIINYQAFIFTCISVFFTKYNTEL